jgi:hypothetical protein
MKIRNLQWWERLKYTFQAVAIKFLNGVNTMMNIVCAQNKMKYSTGGMFKIETKLAEKSSGNNFIAELNLLVYNMCVP